MLWMYYYKKKDCTAVNLNFLQYVKHEIQKSSSFFLNSKKIKENVLCNVDKRFILIHPAGGAHQLSGILGVCKLRNEQIISIQIREVKSIS